MKVKDADGKEKYDGFTVELLDRVAEMANFDYTIEIPDDGNFGVLDRKTKKWNGMMGAVVHGVSFHDDVYIC